jgi:hypothetical protein
VPADVPSVWLLVVWLPVLPCSAPAAFASSQSRARAMPPRRSRRQAVVSVSLCDVPESLLSRILLDAVTTHDLLRWVGRVAKVCPKWWRIVRRSPAYGLALPQGFRLHGELAWADYREGEDERARVLRTISERLQDAAADRRHLHLDESYVGDAGGRALAVALQAWPAPLALDQVRLRECDLTAAGSVPPIAAALRRGFAGSGLETLALTGNTGLGDAGIVALAAVLPPSLTRLDFQMIGCGNAGMIAVAAALPPLLRLQELNCDDNPLIGDAGFSALAGALPQLPELSYVCASGSTSLGLEGAMAIAAALRPAAGGGARCLNLGTFDLQDSGIPDSGKQELRGAWQAHVSAPRPVVLCGAMFL